MGTANAWAGAARAPRQSPAQAGLIQSRQDALKQVRDGIWHAALEYLIKPVKAC